MNAAVDHGPAEGGKGEELKGVRQVRQTQMQMKWPFNIIVSIYEKYFMLHLTDYGD